MVSIKTCISSFLFTAVVNANLELGQLRTSTPNENADKLCLGLYNNVQQLRPAVMDDYIRYPNTMPLSMESINALFPGSDLLSAAKASDFGHDAVGIKCLKEVTSAWYQPKFQGHPMYNYVFNIRYNFLACPEEAPTAAPTPAPTPAKSRPKVKTPLSQNALKKVVKKKAVKKKALKPKQKITLLQDSRYNGYSGDDDDYYGEDPYESCSCSAPKQVQTEFLVYCDGGTGDKNLDFDFNLFNILKYNLPKPLNGRYN